MKDFGTAVVHIDQEGHEMNKNIDKENMNVGCPCEGESNARGAALAAAQRPEADSTRNESFDAFWAEFTDWWGLEGEEEELTLKKGKEEYKLRCFWDEGTLLVAMSAPWAEEWDYVQLYRGMFGWGDVGQGFYSRALRKKVAKLLLAEIIRRKKWLQENPDAAVQRDRDLREERAKAEETIRKIENDIASLEEKKGDLSKEDYDKEKSRLDKSLNGAKSQYDAASHLWNAKYWWTRNRMESAYEGDMRLYVKGVNRLWGAPIHCQWALSDMRRESAKSGGRRRTDSARAADKDAAADGEEEARPRDGRSRSFADFFGEV